MRSNAFVTILLCGQVLKFTQHLLAVRNCQRQVFSLIVDCCLVLSGCHAQPRSLKVDAPDFDAGTAGLKAVEIYDADGDSQLSAKELEACPGIAGHLTFYDSDSDGQVSAEELAARIEQWEERGAGLLPLRCEIKLDGRALAGAKVDLEPEPFLAEALKRASGITGPDGVAEISLQPEELPEQFKGLPVLAPGLYKVVVTHPRKALPARYNKRTTLGCEVSERTANPSIPVRFLLRSK